MKNAERATRTRPWWSIWTACFWFGVHPACAQQPKSDSAASFQYTENVVAGGPNDFMEVRHLILRGSHRAIGRKLAEIARDRHGVRMVDSEDPLRTRAQRHHFQRHAPNHLERMRGAAAAFGADLENDRHNFSRLAYEIAVPGCSVVYYPPSTTADGAGVLSRNYDFTTGTLMGILPLGDTLPCTARPYVMEVYPDAGYATLSLCSYDLLGGVIDGVNEKGLTVALLADDELQEMGRFDPAIRTQAGFDVLQITRFLLETCADVKEAKVALLGAKLYYSAIPCHIIVADAGGQSFIWENAASMNYGHVIEGGGNPQIATNFLQHLHPEVHDPARSAAKTLCPRFDTLQKRIATGGKFSRDFIRESNALVAAAGPAPPKPFASVRTLWHAMYVPEQKRVEVDFYLGESPDKEGGPPVIRRSGYISFSLGGR